MPYNDGTVSTTATQLSLLENASLIRLVAARPELEYIFRHALVREAAYGSLLHRQRRLLHQAVGEALEAGTTSEAQRTELTPVLAYHFDEAGDEARALRYFTQAGEAAAAQYALPEAIGFFTRALEIARRQADVSTETLVALYRQRGRALQSSDQVDAAWQNYLDLEAESQARGEARLRLTAMIERATLLAVFSSLFNPAGAVSLSQAALVLAEQLDDRPAQARILWNMMRATSYNDPQAAIAIGERSLALAREAGDALQLGFSLQDLQYPYRTLGQHARALALLDESRAVWRGLQEWHMLADNLNQTAMLRLPRGEWDEAEAFTREAVQVALSSHSDTQLRLTYLQLSRLHCERGRCDLALDDLAASEQLPGEAWHRGMIGNARALVWASLGALELVAADFEVRTAPLRATPLWPLICPGLLGQQAHTLVRLGQGPAAAALIEDAHRLASLPIRLAGLTLNSVDRLFLAEIELALAHGEVRTALDLAEQYVVVLNTHGLRGLLPDALLVQATVLEASGQPEAAVAALSEARGIAQAIGQRRTLWQILARQAEHAAQQGQPQAAAALRAEAAGQAAFMAEHAGSPELRATFLSLPAVRAVLHSP